MADREGGEAGVRGDGTPEKEREPCSDCDGQGYYVSWPHTTCPTCSGSGLDVVATLRRTADAMSASPETREEMQELGPFLPLGPSRG